MIFIKKYLRFLVILSLVLLIFVVFQKNRANKQNWQFFIKNQVGAKSVLNVGKNLTFDENNIYFSDGKGLIHALNKKTGQVIWLNQFNDHSPFEIAQDKEALYIASFDSHIYKLDKKNGYVIWSFAIPNQFWPDSEVVFDENDHLLFFADRGGFLYALDKKTGKEIWKKEFGTIDNSKTFKEGSIHFGFLRQDDEQLIVDHFPKAKKIIIDKQTGNVLSEETTQSAVILKQEKYNLQFSPYNLIVKQNVISQPQFNLFNQEQKLIWSYQTKQKTNLKEIYQDNDRIYYLDANNQLLSSIKISNQDPSKEPFKKINFKIKEDYSKHQPFEKNPNPQISYEAVTNINWPLKFKQIWLFLEYLFKNLWQVTEFNLQAEEKNSYLEFSVSHQQNFYKNVFTDVKIEAEFVNQNNENEKVTVKGFYYDHNLWKIRTKLNKGDWNWQITIKTPLWINKQNGNIKITNDLTNSITIQDGIFVSQNNEIFLPIGLQNAILDQNMDGNPLNQMSIKTPTLLTDEKNSSNYLNFPDYLDLYKDKASINFFRYGPDNWAPAIWENLENTKNFAMDVNGNLQGDIIINEAKKRNMKIMMSIFSFYPPYTTKEAIAKKENQLVITKYLDYVIARYASNVDLWELTNEATPPLEWQNFVSDYLAENDPYKHPITTSLEEPKLNNSELLSIHIYTHPKNNSELIKQIEKLLQKPAQENWQGAIIISEIGFGDDNYFSGSADSMRKMIWVLAFKKIGIVYWNFGDIFLQKDGTSDIYIGLKEYHLNELQKFLSGIQAPIISSFEISNQDQLAIYKLENKELKLFYLMKLKDEKNSSFELPITIEEDSSVQIIDPKSNKILEKISIDKLTTKIQLPKFTDDLAIRISKI